MDLDPNFDINTTRYGQWKKAEKELHDCILWNKAKDKAGYGVSWLNGKYIRAHVKAFKLSKGDIPVGLLVRHTCDNRACCNPEHLVLGTYKDNSQDMVTRNRQAKGEQVGTSKLTEDIIKMIRSMNGTSRQIAEFFGCSKTQVLSIKNNTSWKHL